MEILKTKDAAELLSVSQTTIKRWAAMFPDFFPKDRFGHYTFSEQQISLLSHIKDCINHGEPLESIQLSIPNENQMSKSLQDPIHHTDAEPMQDILSRIHYIERTLDQKADEVVMIQLLQQREELEDLRMMIKEIAASLEPTQVSKGNYYPPNEASPPVTTTRLPSPPRKRGLLRSFFFL
ncbi:MerR family transcriptional regulator [Paenibacillus sp. FSL R10-2734]|uniref:MerR family transcriptional regulator n=1 Tax=Paenibacillus sp. FSL R10-2734 TaxID=2954691 RepID=UPI0030D8D8AA